MYLTVDEIRGNLGSALFHFLAQASRGHGVVLCTSVLNFITTNHVGFLLKHVSIQIKPSNAILQVSFMPQPLKAVIKCAAAATISNVKRNLLFPYLMSTANL